MKRENIIQTKSFDFALVIIKLYTQLVEEKEYVISKQLLRCGTSIGSNVEEALAGYSRKDFLCKMSISSKEARETRYWLRLLKHSELTQVNLDSILEDINQIINILTSIVKTTQHSNS
ncbi:four helix bundle protein [Gracilimonas mengyeensis]|uniref:Four helix bundle protein n=1 Tax=Gracilimonas mengyeensis TaxID=1302730 RepID=A0A521CLP4_9BACT|nr:four helix bundle protein [Gracilimonas mengyeensis]SMO60362.1 four helix bundle protein [Gracilimonas mengyeensis]